MRLQVQRLRAPLRAPFHTAHGSVGEIERVVVTLTDADGSLGRGEVTVLPWYDGVDAAAVTRALHAWRPEGPAPDLPQAAAALDLALWDLRGVRAGEPVWRLLGAEAPPAVRVNATISADPPGRAAAQAQQARAAGFTCIKVKAGTPGDLARVSAVREAAGELLLRLDANGAWEEQEALARLEELAPYGIELCEEPSRGVAANARVAELAPVLVALDESARLPGALERRHADAVCLKVAGCGGISGLLAAARQARASGYRVYLASTLDGPRGIAAALHAAALVAPDLACGLATATLFAGIDPLPPCEGVMRAPSGPGLGV